MLEVIERAHKSGIAIQSDWARVNGAAVAAAASLGCITTQLPSHFTRTWRPTAVGLRLLERYG